MPDVLLQPYIQRCLKKAQPTLKLSAELGDKLNKRLNRLARALVRGGVKSAQAAGRKTLLHKDLEVALFKISTDQALCGKLLHQGATATAGLDSSSSKVKQARSRRAGLVFSIARAAAILRSGTGELRISEGAAVYLAAILEGLVLETFTIAGQVCLDDHRKVITVKDFEKAVESSKSLQDVFS